jgi:hypothetical protein
MNLTGRPRTMIVETIPTFGFLGNLLILLINQILSQQFKKQYENGILPAIRFNLPCFLTTTKNNP